jgi:hypothetical protein
MAPVMQQTRGDQSVAVAAQQQQWQQRHSINTAADISAGAVLSKQL